ncbi:MAG: hypothetical protein WCL53_09960 [Chloroflexota bacterium]
MQPHIVLDMDGVLADFIGGLLPVVSDVLGREVREEHITEYYFEHALRIEPAVWTALWEAHEHRLYRECLPYPGVHEGLKRLAQLGRLSIHTARPVQAEAATRAWISEHLGLELDVRFFPGAVKYTAAYEVDYFVDDNLSEIASAQAGRGFVMDRPWNRTGAAAATRRVSSLEEVAAHIEADLAR